jgi:hypothetical protein
MPLPRRAFLSSIVPGILAGMAYSAAWAQTSTTAFDGTWDVKIVCHAKDEAKGYTLAFPATIHDGMLHGEYHTHDTPPWMALDGPIAADGHARLKAAGLTGGEEYTMGHLRPSSPYGYTMDATFSATAGRGERLGARSCYGTFTKR